MAFEAYETSSAQVRIYLEHELHGSTILYNIPFARIIEGNLDVSRLESAFNWLANRHESLRTAFILKNGEILQLVYDKITIDLPSQPAVTGEINKIIDAFFRPFELDCPPLWRVQLAKFNKNKYLLLFDIHHIIADGESILIIFKELTAFYQGVVLPPQEFQYVDFTLWQNDLFAGEEIKKQEQYWLDLFKKDAPRLSLPTDFPKDRNNDDSGSNVYLEIEPGLAVGIEELARSYNITLNMIFLSAYFILLWRYTGQEDIVVGTSVAGRPSEEMKNIVGMFVNILVLRCSIFPEMSFGSFLEYFTGRVTSAFENQDYPFEKLIEKLNSWQQRGQHALPEALFVFLNLDDTDPELVLTEMSPGEKELRFIDYSIRNKTAKTEIILTVSQRSRLFKLDVEYAVRLFTRETIRIMIDNFKEILSVIVKNRKIRLKDINLSHGLGAIQSNLMKEDNGDFKF